MNQEKYFSEYLSKKRSVDKSTFFDFRKFFTKHFVNIFLRFWYFVYEDFCATYLSAKSASVSPKRLRTTKTKHTLENVQSTSIETSAPPCSCKGSIAVKETSFHRKHTVVPCANRLSRHPRSIKKEPTAPAILVFFSRRTDSSRHPRSIKKEPTAPVTRSIKKNEYSD